jgi:hypothetical protein
MFIFFKPGESAPVECLVIWILLMSQKNMFVEVQLRSSIELSEDRMQSLLDIPEVAVMVEAAYRRGFYQGAWRMLKMWNDGATRKAVTNWLYETLCFWRNKRHDGEFEQPPQLAIVTDAVELTKLQAELTHITDQMWSAVGSQSELIEAALRMGDVPYELGSACARLVAMELALRKSGINS